MKVIVAWGAFALFHSVTVSEPYERWARRVMGEDRFRAYHRLLFTLYSAAATAAVLLYVRSLPDTPPLPHRRMAPLPLPRGSRFCGAALLLWTPWDLKEFVGLRQWERHRRGEGEAPGRNERLFTGKGYGLVRHPLYLGCSLLLAFHPAQTRNGAATAAAVIAYFYIGTFFEERRLVRAVRRGVPGIPAPRAAVPPAPAPVGYISRERMDRSANARTERGASPRTRTAAAEMHSAREKAVRGGRGTGTSPGAGSMYM